MSLYTLKAYLSYSLEAKTRHGVHSPFVYELTDQVLRKRRSRASGSGAPIPDSIPANYRSLLSDIMDHFANQGEYFEYSFLNEPDAEKMNQQFEQLLSKATDKTVIFLSNIHCSAAHTAAWKQITNEHKVMLSLELWQTGILFFKSDFKQKQHFVLKCCLKS